MEAGLSRSWNLAGYASRSLAADDRAGDLMVGYQSGDAAAFRELYALLRPVLATYLRSLGARQATLDALLDEAFLQIHAARRTWSPGSAVEPWARAVAGHVFRKLGRLEGPGDGRPTRG